ncbi:MAG: histidine kinase dimerization/phospho-acceptor domain-containing protein [Anaeromyxobacteraceae bacterium]
MASEEEEAERRAGKLGFVAHEVRNPLSTALWTAELLSRMSAADRGGARGEKMADMMLRALGRVRQLVEDHFLTERLDVGGIPNRPDSQAIGPALEAAAGRRAADLGAVSVEAVEGLSVLVDKILLDRLLDLLVAGVAGEGTATTASARGDGPVVRVRLSGRPVAAEALADPMKGSPSDMKGRALSLPLARRVAAALGGELRVVDGALEVSLPAAV